MVSSDGVSEQSEGAPVAIANEHTCHLIQPAGADVPDEESSVDTMTASTAMMPMMLENNLRMSRNDLLKIQNWKLTGIPQKLARAFDEITEKYCRLRMTISQYFFDN